MAWDWVFELDTWPARAARLANWVYRTHMSLAWIVAYGLLLYLSWEHLRIRWATLFALFGVVFFLLTIFSHSQDLSIYRKARIAVYDFAEAAFAELKGVPASPVMDARMKELNAAMARLHRWLYPKDSTHGK